MLIFLINKLQFGPSISQIGSQITQKSKHKLIISVIIYYFNILYAYRYFSIKIILEESKEEIDKIGPCIFSLEPHDVLPVSIFWCHKSMNIFPNHSIVGCMTSILFKIPFIRHVYSWLSATSIDKKNLIRLVGKKKSLVIIPGGEYNILKKK